jgi:hypothetical protein
MKETTENDSFSTMFPFLLQAQDMMTRLESRVIQLETDLSVNQNYTIHYIYIHNILCFI